MSDLEPFDAENGPDGPAKPIMTYKGFVVQQRTGAPAPTHLSYPCQQAGAEEGERCWITINGNKNSMGAGWQVEGGATEAGPIAKPTVTPSVHCQGRCHFFIKEGRFHHCGDYPQKGITEP